MPQARLTEKAYMTVSRLAKETGQTQQEVIERALELYERERFFSEFNDGFARLQEDESAWSELLAEREEWDVTLSDGSAEE